MSTYDITRTKLFSDHINIDYGFIKGNNTIVFIKVGQNGDIYGYENKYFRIANKINEDFGYTVIVSSNPYNHTNPLDQAMDVIDEYCYDNHFSDYEVLYMGHSNGAVIGFRWGHQYPQIKRMLLINGPLMVNWNHSKKGISKINDKDVFFVYGEIDPSFRYTQFLHPIVNEKDNLHLITVPNAAHNFEGMMDEFINLPFEFLLQSEEESNT